MQKGADMNTDAADLDQYRSWIGRTDSAEDEITAWPVKAMTASLDRDDPPPKRGEPIPLGWHWFYFLEARRHSEIGPDGHPKRGGFLPPIPLPRRMWAGGRMEFRRALRMGEPIRRESEIVSIEPKQGRSGTLVFLTARHTIYGSNEIAAIDEHDIVFREAAKAGEAPAVGKPAPEAAAWRRSLQADPVLLFRFSALTFNGHRIHYDAPYASGEEHYPALVVHGPLQATLLLDLCRRHSARPVARFDYRAMSPLFHTETFTINGKPSANGSSAELWTASAKGATAMAGTVRFG
jgi:3-methylfumaryl-CoA hydratase